MKRTDPSIIVETAIRASAEATWNAITDLEEMKQWYFDNIDEFRPEVGSKSRFPVVSEERTFTHLWEATEVEPLEMIAYNWQYEEYPGESIVTFSIEAHDDTVVVKITTEVLEDFPEEIPEFRRESCRGGWEYFIDRLKEYLTKLSA